MSCTHPFEQINNHNTGICLLCGQERQYDYEGTAKPQIIKPGIDLTAGDPRNLPVERKQAIGKAAKVYGVKAIVKATGLPMLIIRGWVGAYGRDPEKYKRTIELRRKKRKQPDMETAVPPSIGISLAQKKTLPSASSIRKRGKYTLYNF
ncbi:MAG TPA: hypothetical protein VMV84_06465 [Dehalococcoidales bacterium]|nr:hypothetical protein [Dehalococcoidales bacterium]